MDEGVLERKLERARAEIRGLEEMIETKARDLFLSRESLRKSSRFLENILATMGSALVVVDAHGYVMQANEAAARQLGRAEGELIGTDVRSFVRLPDDDASLLVEHSEVEVELADGSTAPTLFSSSEMVAEDGEVEGYVCVWVDLSEKKQLEVELRHAQKLESLGQMAAGVAHEINTPIQYVGDSLRFLQEAFDDVLAALNAHHAASETWGAQAGNEALLAGVREAEEEADIEFVEEEAPGAFQRATGGLQRVAAIVKALKSFSHPGSEEMAPTDINEALRTTLTLANNEYKYVAELHTEYGEIPEVPGHAGDLGQVFLNLVVNAAHAIEEKVAGTEERGTIRITTARASDGVVITISDTGAGIPAHVVDRIFDPFFTTKEVGKGTGQGLAISRRIVVESHGGRLDVDTTPGEGTTFRITLPFASKAEAA